jgi:hypothetical protein
MEPNAPSTNKIKLRLHNEKYLVRASRFFIHDASGLRDGYELLAQKVGTFCDKNEEQLNLRFSREHAFQTSTRGLKIRGVFNTQEEAEIRCKKLREVDPNHDIFVGPVGMWIPWDPDAYKTGRVEFMEEELNQLHNEKLKNEERAKQAFDQRVKEAKKKAIMENIELAKKSGNVLTQTIDESGNLIGVNQKVNFEEREAAETDNSDAHAQQLREALKNAENSKV